MRVCKCMRRCARLCTYFFAASSILPSIASIASLPVRRREPRHAKRVDVMSVGPVRIRIRPGLGQAAVFGSPRFSFDHDDLAVDARCEDSRLCLVHRQSEDVGSVLRDRLAEGLVEVEVEVEVEVTVAVE